MEQQNFAAQFGELEAHPLAPSHPEADKLLMLYRNLDPNKPKNYVEKASRENLWHADVTYKKAPPRGAVCAASWARNRRRHHVVQHGDGL